jgi:hypothetical protein
MVHSIARGLNRALLGEAVVSFLQQGSPSLRAGRLGAMDNTNAGAYILEAEEVLQTNLAPDGPYWGLVHQTANTNLMDTAGFKFADNRGEPGTILTGRVGEIFNTNTVMSQDVPYVNGAIADRQTATINNAGGYVAGSTAAMTVTDPGDNYQVGEYVVIAGNDQPTFLTATNGTTSITLNEALKYAVANSAVVYHYRAATNEATERAAGYKKSMVFTHNAGLNLQVGQIISFGTGASRHSYVIIEVSATTSTTSTVLLHKPLTATVASGATAFPGPGGSFNPIWHPDALALVGRPMTPHVNGATSGVQTFEGMSIRISLQDDLLNAGLRVVADALYGLTALDTNLCTVMLG